MRYLLLSVLVVCMIGIMVPSVFGDEEPVMEGLYFYTGDFCSEDEPCSLVHAGEYYEKAGLGERFELQEEYHGGGTGTNNGLWFFDRANCFPASEFYPATKLHEIRLDTKVIIKAEVYPDHLVSESCPPYNVCYDYEKLRFELFDPDNILLTSVDVRAGSFVYVFEKGGFMEDDGRIVEPERKDGTYTFNLVYDGKILDSVKKTFQFKSLANECTGIDVYDNAIATNQIIGFRNLSTLSPDEELGLLTPIANYNENTLNFYIIIGVVAIGGIIGAIAVARRGSKTPKPVKQKPKPVKQKPAKKKETSTSCSNCGKKLKPTAKFCGGCGTPVS